MPTVQEQLEQMKSQILSMIHDFEEENNLVICKIELESPTCTDMSGNIKKDGHRLWFVIKQ